MGSVSPQPPTAAPTPQGLAAATVELPAGRLHHTAPQTLLPVLVPVQAGLTWPRAAGLLLAPRRSARPATITAVTPLLLWHQTPPLTLHTLLRRVLPGSGVSASPHPRQPGWAGVFPGLFSGGSTGQPSTPSGRCLRLGFMGRVRADPGVMGGAAKTAARGGVASEGRGTRPGRRRWPAHQAPTVLLNQTPPDARHGQEILNAAKLNH